MKKGIFLLLISTLFSLGSFAQKAEVLYFKANLPCCHARSCNALENEVKQVVTNNFQNGDVVFKVVRLDDKQNEKLIQQHNAKSQTVVIVSKKRNNETSMEVSDIIRQYQRNGNKTELEKELLAKINQSLR